MNEFRDILNSNLINQSVDLNDPISRNNAMNYLHYLSNLEDPKSNIHLVTKISCSINIDGKMPVNLISIESSPYKILLHFVAFHFIEDNPENNRWNSLYHFDSNSDPSQELEASGKVIAFEKETKGQTNGGYLTLKVNVNDSTISLLEKKSQGFDLAFEIETKKSVNMKRTYFAKYTLKMNVKNENLDLETMKILASFHYQSNFSEFSLKENFKASLRFKLKNIFIDAIQNLFEKYDKELKKKLRRQNETYGKVFNEFIIAKSNENQELIEQICFENLISFGIFPFEVELTEQANYKERIGLGIFHCLSCCQSTNIFPWSGYYHASFYFGTKRFHFLPDDKLVTQSKFDKYFSDKHNFRTRILDFSPLESWKYNLAGILNKFMEFYLVKSRPMPAFCELFESFSASAAKKISLLPQLMFEHRFSHIENEVQKYFTMLEFDTELDKISNQFLDIYKNELYKNGLIQYFCKTNAIQEMTKFSQFCNNCQVPVVEFVCQIIQNFGMYYSGFSFTTSQIIEPAPNSRLLKAQTFPPPNQGINRGNHMRSHPHINIDEKEDISFLEIINLNTLFSSDCFAKTLCEEIFKEENFEKISFCEKLDFYRFFGDEPLNNILAWIISLENQNIRSKRKRCLNLCNFSVEEMKSTILALNKFTFDSILEIFKIQDNLKTKLIVVLFKFILDFHFLFKVNKSFPLTFFIFFFENFVIWLKSEANRYKAMMNMNTSQTYFIKYHRVKNIVTKIVQALSSIFYKLAQFTLVKNSKEESLEIGMLGYWLGKNRLPRFPDEKAVNSVFEESIDSETFYSISQQR